VVDTSDPAFDQQFDDLLKALNKLVQNLDPTSTQNKQLRRGNVRDWLNEDGSPQGPVKTAIKKTANAHSNLKSAADNVHNSFVKLGGSADGLLGAFKEIAELFVFGKTINYLIEGGEQLTKTYTRLSNIGQNFGGSMIQMGLQAAQAGVPLETFADLLQRNATASAVMATNNLAGSESMGQFAKNIRDNLKQFGFYGMNIEQLNDLTSDYAETLRKQNLLTGANTKINTQSIIQFAKDLSDFSSVTGKAKDQIAADTNSALQDISLQSTPISAQQMQQITNATAGLASLPGDTGTSLSKSLVQTIGYGGVQFSDLGKELYSAGMGDIAQNLQNYADKVQSGTATKQDLANFVQMLQDAGISKQDFINLQAKAGNTDVAQLGSMLYSLNGIKAGDLAKDNAADDANNGITNFFETLENTLNSLTTSFKEAFYKALMPLNAVFGTTGDTITNKLAPAFSILGGAVGSFINMLLTGNTLNDLGSLITSFTNWVKKITPDDIKNGVVKLYHGVLDVISIFEKIEKALTYVATAITSVYKMFYDISTKLGFGNGTSKTISAVGGTALLAGAAGGLKLLWDKTIGKLFGVGKMYVNAAIVYLNTGIGKGTTGAFDWLKKKIGLGGETAAVTEGSEAGLGAGAAGIATTAVAGLAALGLMGATVGGFYNNYEHPGDIANARRFGGRFGIGTGTNDLMDQFNATQAQIVSDTTNLNKPGTSKNQQEMLLKEIQTLLQKQLDLQKQIGVVGTTLQKKQVSTAIQTDKAIKRINT
jgi:hypothetical protein